MISFSEEYYKLIASIAEDAGVTPEDIIKDAPTMRVDDLK